MVPVGVVGITPVTGGDPEAKHILKSTVRGKRGGDRQMITDGRRATPLEVRHVQFPIKGVCQPSTKHLGLVKSELYDK